MCEFTVSVRARAALMMRALFFCFVCLNVRAAARGFETGAVQQCRSYKRDRTVDLPPPPAGGKSMLFFVEFRSAVRSEPSR